MDAYSPISTLTILPAFRRAVMDSGSSHAVIRRFIEDRVGVRGTMINPGNSGASSQDVAGVFRNAGG